jgi:nucleotide-binding universal stress UspA family protein
MIKHSIKKILVALDGSKQAFNALDEAIYLARQCGATITGLCVTPLYVGNFGRFTTSLKNQSLKEAKEFMAFAKKRCAQNGIVFYQKIIIDNHTSEIAQYASEKKFDLLVIGSRGMSPVKELFLGSVANYTVHKSKIPVLVIK